MIVYAAIDLRQGRVVQLIGGRPEAERLSLPDPVAVGRQFESQGFRAVHVVDLDGALDDGSNATEIERLIDAINVPVQIGGGIRDRDGIRHWLDAGARRCIVGTRAIEDADWLARAAEEFPDRLVVAADVRGGEVVTHGWTRAAGVTAHAFIAELAGVPLAGLLVTDVGREGSLAGIDGDLFADLARNSDFPIVAAGGIGTLDDLRVLDASGVAGAVVGTALYTGDIDPVAAAKEFHNEQAS